MTSSYDDKIDHLIDTRGISPEMARSIVGADDTTDEIARSPIPGKPLSFPRRGNVRDSHDGGRADQYRGGAQATEALTEEELTRKARGVAMAREILANANRELTPDEISAKQKAEAEELRRKASESWKGTI